MIPAPISLTEKQIFTATVAFLNGIGLAPFVAGEPVPVIRGQVNRVPQPAQTDYVVIWPVTRARLATNTDTLADVIVTGAIASNVLTASAVTGGALVTGAFLVGSNVTPGCQVQQQTGGTPGGAGTYALTPTADGAGPYYAGTQASLQPVEVTLQADVHGPASADNAARIGTLFRDQYGVAAFQASGFDVAPLYASDPRQTAFDNGEQQIEERWSIDLCMQANIAVTTPMQFADQLHATAYSVCAEAA